MGTACSGKGAAAELRFPALGEGEGWELSYVFAVLPLPDNTAPMSREFKPQFRGTE
jgi:hypothetical protein